MADLRILRLQVRPAFGGSSVLPSGAGSPAGFLSSMGARNAFARKVVAALAAATLISCADAKSPAPLLRKNEIKLYVTAENAGQAMQALKLDEHKAKKRTVVFFDTSDRALAAQHLILRARQGGKGSRGDSTVKLRAPAGATELSAAELAIQPEQDWTNEHEPTLSRSKDRESIAKGLVSQVIAGELAVAELFDAGQQELVTARMKNFNWSDLRLYGPVKASVWRQQWKLDGFPEDVTVELWRLKKAGETKEILEVSANTRAETDEQAKELAQRFFAAAKAAGMGEPSGQTKTQMVLDFFQPGVAPVK